MKEIKQEDFRSAMARLASAVTLVSTDGPAGRRGLVATAVTSVTDAPPSLLVWVNKSAKSNHVIRCNGAFCVNILSGEQADLVDLFMGKGDADPFESADVWQSLETALSD